MPKRGSFASGVADEARRRMGTAVSQAEFKRWQAVWLAAGEDGRQTAGFPRGDRTACGFAAAFALG